MLHFSPQRCILSASLRPTAQSAHVRNSNCWLDIMHEGVCIVLQTAGPYYKACACAVAANTVTTYPCDCAAGVATAAMIQFKPVDAEGIQDRAYRIDYNEGQNRTDRFTQVASCGHPTSATSATSTCMTHQSHSCAAIAIQHTTRKRFQDICHRCA